MRPPITTDLLACLSAIDRELNLAGDAIRAGELFKARKALRHALGCRAHASAMVRELKIVLRALVEEKR